MARQRTSAAEDLVIIASKLPWWAGLTLALLSYLVLHIIASRPIMPHTLAPGQMGDAVAKGLITTLAMFGQYILPFLFCLGAIGSVIAVARQKKLYSSVVSRPGGVAFNEITWRQFEMLVGEYFRRQGFDVIRQGGDGPDGGVDLILRNKGENYFVQCKQWKAYRVGVQPVRELYGVMASRGAAGGYVVTSGSFTEEAREFVRGLNIELIDGDQLTQMMNAVSSLSNAATPEQVETSVPACPKCGSEMKKRVARQGVNAGREFWGCSAFPKCNGALPLRQVGSDSPSGSAVQPAISTGHEKKACPHCGGDLVIRQFQSGPKAGQEFYGCLPCKKGWPVAR